jgi:hypothetical protein
VAALAIAACSIGVIDHDPSIAAARAVEFADLAFVQGAAERSHDLLTDDTKKTTSVAAFGEVLQRMHPKTRPPSVRATEFEPVPGQKMISIFLRGENGDELFFYRLVMSGTASAGYRVAGLFRGSGPYPESKLRREL